MKAGILLEEAVSLPVEERVHLVDCLLPEAWAALREMIFDGYVTVNC